MKENNKKYKEFIGEFSSVRENVKLADLTAYKIGGPADLYVEAKTSYDIPEFIQKAEELDIPYYILGGGCNIVFSDAGFRGLVIHNKAGKIEVHGNRIIAESGAMLGAVIAKAREHELGGIVNMIGLPGTIGGAVYGNAGAQGVEIGSFIEEVKIFNLESGVKEEGREYFQFAYRWSILKKTHEIVLEVTLILPPLDPNDVALEVMKFRASKQPKGNVAGSFFKNPTANESAGFLIDKAGLKGLCEGGVEVSQLHGNWLMNTGNGTQKDVINLAKKIKKEVFDQFKIELEPENIVIDEYGNGVDI